MRLKECVSGFLFKLKQEFSFIRGNLLILIVSWMFLGFSNSLAAPFDSLYRRELGVSPFILGLMESVGALIRFLVRIPGALIADKHGRRYITVIMTYALSFSFLFYIFATDWRFILLGIIFQNFCLIYSPALEALHADSIPSEKRGMGFAASDTIPILPSIISPLLAGFLLEQYGLVFGMRIVYSIVFLCSLAAAVSRNYLKETLKISKDIGVKELGTTFRASISSMVEVWKSIPKSLAFLTLAILVSAFTDPMFRLFFTLYASDVIGMSRIDWGLLNMVAIVVMLIAGLPLGKIIDIIGRKKSIILAYILVIPSIMGLIVSRNFTQLIGIFIVFTLGTLWMGPATRSLVTDFTPQDKRGRVMGAIGMLNILATIPSSTIAGFLYQINPAYPFILIIIMESIAILIVIFLIKEPQKMEI